MGEEHVTLLIEGGNASAGPPLGPSLAPIEGVDIGQVVNQINEKTKDFEGMEVPVDVVVDTDTGSVDITVGLPPAAALIKERAGVASGSGEPNTTKVGNIEFADAIEVAQMKMDDLNALTLDSAVKEILGSCRSLGITIDEKDAETVTREVNDGEYDEQLQQAQEGEQ